MTDETETTQRQDDDAAQKAQEAEEKHEAAKAKMEEIEQNPPEKLEDWPDDEAKYETFGGPEGQHTYEEGPERKLGPSSLRHHEDGSVSIEGEKVDDPDEYKTEPIPGGPTDPDTPKASGERDLTQDEDGGDGEQTDEEQSEDTEARSGEDEK